MAPIVCCEYSWCRAHSSGAHARLFPVGWVRAFSRVRPAGVFEIGLGFYPDTRHVIMWITGQVLDADGRGVRGVTVEACSPCITGKRSVVTDTRGQYVLQDLKPGAYTIQFAHSDFAMLERTTNALTSYVATINARLASRR
jgi:protocatechuate 3,4-dioxygenase beta subunit